jgi:serine/threonine protein phosphatase PrpC
MGAELKVAAGQSTDPGVKPANDDSCGIFIPEGSLLFTKGMAAVIADGMSSSEGGREAAETCVLGFLSDYFSTPESWSVKKSGGKVLSALNRWLYGQGQKLYGSCRGMVTTLSILVLNSATANLFHVGETRIHRLRDNELECLTRDHRALLSVNKHCLTRAMGIELELMIDYRCVPLERGDLFLLTTDGVHDFLSNQ